MPKAPKLPVFDVAELELIESALYEAAFKLETIAKCHDEPRCSELLAEAKAMRVLDKKVGKPLGILRAQARVAELQRELAAERRRSRVK